MTGTPPPPHPSATQLESQPKVPESLDQERGEEQWERVCGRRREYTSELSNKQMEYKLEKDRLAVELKEDQGPGYKERSSGCPNRAQVEGPDRGRPIYQRAEA